jgi:hypothetical protein
LAATAYGLTPGAVEQAAVERGLRAVIEEIRAIPGFERFLHTATLADIVQAAGGMPLVYLVNAPSGSYVLAIPRRAPGDGQDVPVVRAIPVPEVTSMSIFHFVFVSPEGGGTPGLVLAQASGQLRRRRHISEALARINIFEPLMRPIAQLVADNPAHEAVVIPTGLLGLVPLHAVPLNPISGEVLDDTGTLFFSPSAAVHAASRAKAARQPKAAPSLVAVTDPDGTLAGVPLIVTLVAPVAGPEPGATAVTAGFATVVEVATTPGPVLGAGVVGVATACDGVGKTGPSVNARHGATSHTNPCRGRPNLRTPPTALLKECPNMVSPQNTWPRPTAHASRRGRRTHGSARAERARPFLQH